jgi:hypothetical protein
MGISVAYNNEGIQLSVLHGTAELNGFFSRKEKAMREVTVKPWIGCAVAGTTLDKNKVVGLTVHITKDGSVVANLPPAALSSRLVLTRLRLGEYIIGCLQDEAGWFVD